MVGLLARSVRLRAWQIGGSSAYSLLIYWTSFLIRKLANRRSRYPVFSFGGLDSSSAILPPVSHLLQGLRFFLQGLSYQDLTEQCFQLLVHQLNAGFKLLEHGFADMQFFTVIEAPGPEQ